MLILHNVLCSKSICLIYVLIQRLNGETYFIITLRLSVIRLLVIRSIKTSVFTLVGTFQLAVNHLKGGFFNTQASNLLDA